MLPQQSFVPRLLNQALIVLGDYVYGYYRWNEDQPFYIGKGRKGRVLEHWNEAVKGKDRHQQYKIIRDELDAGRPPIVRILAYNLEQTRGKEVYSVIERVMQNTFGVAKSREREIGHNRIKQTSSLVQDRNDGLAYPPLSLEAAYCKGAFDRFEVVDLKSLEEKAGCPVLFVSVSGSYHPRYSQHELAEKARMYWKITKYKKYPNLRAHKAAILLAWTSKWGAPQLCGAWRIRKGSFASCGDRVFCEVHWEPELQKELLGLRLAGSGKSYQKTRILA